MKLPGHVGRLWPSRWLRSSAPSLFLAAMAITALVWLASSPGAPPVSLQYAQPAPGAQLDSAPDQVLLRLDESAVTGARTTVAVLGPKDQNLARGPASHSVDGVSQRVAPPRHRGAYQVSYEVVSPDGLVTKGSYWFYFAPASGSVPTWLGLAALVLTATGAAVVIALLQRRPRTAELPGPAPVHGLTSTSHTVPKQRNRDHHQGPSSPGRGPRPTSGPEAVPPEALAPEAVPPEAVPEGSEPRQS